MQSKTVMAEATRGEQRVVQRQWGRLSVPEGAAHMQARRLVSFDSWCDAHAEHQGGRSPRSSSASLLHLTLH